MIHLGLVGYPLEHSLSPLLHHTALRAAGLQGEYELYPVRPAGRGALRGLVQQVRDGQIHGLNVTIPYKQMITRLSDDLSPAAASIGAVNTIYLRGGRVIGDNSDSAGFLADLQRWITNPRSAIVLGAGGAARAVVHALAGLGCRVCLASRRTHPAQALARQFANVVAVPLSYDALKGVEADLLVNATPAGMFPDLDQCAWPPGLSLPGGAAVYDLVYNPFETRLVQQARLEGLGARNGLGMLIEQAILAFELWTGCKVSRSTLEQAVGQALDRT